VRNRTYNVPDQRPFEKFLHKNMPIAHPLSTDFQSFQIECDRWLNKHWSYNFGYHLIRKGEGTIRGEFTEPWLDESVTMESGYKENIPYGVIESKNNFYFGFHYEYNVHVQSDILIGYEYIKNFLHTEGDISRDFYLNLALYFDYNWLVAAI
ncbi:MAG: hypothetical protein KAX28_02140, partial [Candidatus Marinimicrobia bacterium]|nr:hypothetical protein [Candidatus Neomarinimicrobiota bacterium]